MILIDGYFDESGTGSESPSICVAGYIFDSAKIELFDASWNRVLESYNLPFFHMVDCAHGNLPFDKLSKNERVQVQMKLMGLIKRNTINGFVCSAQKKGRSSNALYPLIVQEIVKQIGKWIENTGLEGRASYFFEAGANGQGAADSALLALAADSLQCEAIRYNGHGFVPKLGNPAVQAADYLAWQYHRYARQSDNSEVPRLDFRALMRHPHIIKDLDDPVSTQEYSKSQTYRESKEFVESIFYLPSAEPTELDSVLICGHDGAVVQGVSKSNHFACSNCYRILSRDMDPNNPIGLIRPLMGRMIYQCWCGHFSQVPEVLTPFSKGV